MSVKTALQKTQFRSLDFHLASELVTYMEDSPSRLTPEGAHMLREVIRRAEEHQEEMKDLVLSHVGTWAQKPNITNGELRIVKRFAVGILRSLGYELEAARELVDQECETALDEVRELELRVPAE